MLTLLLTLITATATTTAADPALEAMQKLPALEGRWKGSGWIRTGPGEPSRFVGEETVETRLDGRVLVIEGRHLTPDESEVVHHAFATITWDEDAKDYRFVSFVSNRGDGDHRGYMEDGAFVWENDSPSGRIRFVITVEDDVWHETGQIQRGERWYPMFEMTLQRVED